MLYVLALIFPPLPLLCMGKAGHFLLSLVLVAVSLATMVFGVGFLLWIAPVVHAFAVIGGYNADKRTDRVVKAIQGRK